MLIPCIDPIFTQGLTSKDPLPAGLSKYYMNIVHCEYEVSEVQPKLCTSSPLQ